MPGFEDQQVLQQLLTGMNTMQMQTGLMPGGIPAYNNNNAYAAPPVQTPAQFSNNLAVNFRNTFSYQAVTPPMFGGVTPVPRTGAAQSYLPGATLGGGWGMARQQAQGNAGELLTSAQTVSGIGARSAFSGGLGLLATPFLGPWGGAAVGFGADYLMGDAVERMGQMPFKPFVDRQQRATQLQNMSLNNVRMGSDLSASGIGLSMTASMDLERNLMRTADNRNFKRDTGNMFNRQDMMKLTEISSQVGLLDNSQSVDQIARDMGKIGRALSTFMKVVEEPDVRQALQTMGQMRQLGMSIPETNVAAANARTYARMAGTTVQGVMQAGMQGANIFQQYGMSGATGLNVGMAATGTASMLGSVLDPRTLNMMGGRDGMAQSLASSAAKMSQISAILPGMLKRGKEGKLGVDEAAVHELMTGKKSVQALVRESASRMSGSQGTQFINDFSTQKSELEDEFMNSLGGMGGTLLPLVMGRSLMESGATNNMGAALRIAGLDEKQARTYQLLYEKGTLGDTLRQQQRTAQLERQRARTQRREGLSEAASGDRWSQFGSNVADLTFNVGVGLANTPLMLGGGAPLDMRAKDVRRGLRGLGNAANRFMRENFAEDTDIEEQQLAAGGGRLLRSLRPGELADSTTREQLGKQLDTDAGAQRFLKSWTADKTAPALLDRTNAEIDRYVDQRKRLADINPLVNLGAIGERLFTGPGGTGLTQLGRGGENIVETMQRNRSFFERARSGTLAESFPLFANQDSAATLKARALDQAALGKSIETALSSADGSGIQAIGKKYKLSTGEIATATSQAAGAARDYFKSQKENVGPLSLHTGNPTVGGLEQAIEKALAATPNLSPADKKKLASDLRTEAIRSASQGMTSSEKEFLTKFATGGADVAAQLGPGATQQAFLNKAETTRKETLAQLGIGTGYFDDMDSARQVVGVFSREGKEGDLQQKYLIAKSLDAAANSASDEGTAKKLRAQATKLRADLDADESVTDAQRAGAREGATGAAAQMSKDHLKSMGTAFSREIGKGTLDKSLVHVRKRLQGEAAYEDFAAAGIATLGVEGLNIFKEGAKSGKGVEKLREFMHAKGDTEGLKSLEGLDDVKMLRRIQKRMGRNAEGKFAGGLSQLADGMSEVDARNTETIEALDEARRKDMQTGSSTGAGDLGVVVEHFAKATDVFAQGASDLLASRDREYLGTTVRQGASPALNGKPPF